MFQLSLTPCRRKHNHIITLKSHSLTGMSERVTPEQTEWWLLVILLKIPAVQTIRWKSCSHQFPLPRWRGKRGIIPHDMENIPQKGPLNNSCDEDDGKDTIFKLHFSQSRPASQWWWFPSFWGEQTAMNSSGSRSRTSDAVVVVVILGGGWSSPKSVSCNTETQQQSAFTWREDSLTQESLLSQHMRRSTNNRSAIWFSHTSISYTET